MTSSKPYLIRALYEWIADNYLTPYIVVDAEADGVKVPQQYVEGGRIVLNISMQATSGLQLDNDFIQFSARFSGVSFDLVFPVSAVLAIYARENGRGMAFTEEHDGGETPPSSPSSNNTNSRKTGGGKPKLTLVKS